jgi:hypothetical protein
MSPAGRRAAISAVAGLIAGGAVGVATAWSTGEVGLAFAVGGAVALLMSGTGAVAARNGEKER